jgi:tape measure domain-containing protein
MADVEIKWGSSGASIVYEEIKKVSRSVDEVRAKLKSPIGAEMDPMAFGVKAMQQATGSLHALGIEYEKTRGKMKSPLVSPESLMSVNSFTKKGFTKDLKDLNEQLGNTGNKAQHAGAHLGFVSRILAAMAIRAAAREVYEMANAFQTLQNKVKTVTDEDAVGFTMARLFEAAQNTRTSLESVATAYARTTRSVSSLGKSQEEVLRFTENLSKAITVGGSTAVEASNAMVQLSQGMGSGALRGDELRSVLEQLPIVAELIADKLGVPTSALRKLGSEGKLTTDVVFDAINAGAEKVDAMFQKMEMTVPQAWQRFKNAAIMASEGAKGAMGSLAQMIEYVTNHLDAFITMAEMAAAAIVTVFVVKGINSAITALEGLRVSLTAAKVAQVGLNAATLANPWVAAAAAIITVTAALAPLVSQLQLAETSTTTFGDVWTATWESAMNVFSSKGMTDDIKEVTVQVIGLTEEMQNLMMTMATAVDVATNFGPAVPFKAALAALTGSNFGTMAQDAMKDIINRTNANAENKETDRMIQENKDLLAEDLALSSGKATSATLKGADDYIKEVQDRIDTLEEGGTKALRVQKKLFKILNGMDPAIRDTMSIDQLDSLRRNLEREDDLTHKKTGSGKKITTWSDIMSKAQQKDDIAQMAQYSEQTARIEKKVQDLVNSLDKSQLKGLSADALREKIEAVRAIVAHEEYLLQLKKDQEEQEKILNKSVDERLKLMLEEEKRVAKIQQERINTRNDRNFGIMSDLDPTMAIREQIKDLERFKNEMKDFPEWVDVAQKKIDELTLSLQTAGANIMFMGQLKGIYGPGGTISQGFSDIAAKAIVMNMSLRETKRLMMDLLATISQQALSSLFQLGINSAFGAIGGAMSPSPANPMVRGPGGQPTSITMVPGVMGHADGGYTGDYGVNEVAGIVHGQEYVLNAKATSSIGTQALSHMNKTGKVPETEKAMAGPQVNVHNYAGVQVETSVSKGEITIMIEKAIKEKTPAIVAGAVNNPNSQVSRSLQKNLETERRRR